MTPNCQRVLDAVTKFPGITHAGICQEVRGYPSQVKGTLIWLISNGYVKRDWEDTPMTYWPVVKRKRNS